MNIKNMMYILRSSYYKNDVFRENSFYVIRSDKFVKNAFFFRMCRGLMIRALPAYVKTTADRALNPREFHPRPARVINP